MSNYPDGKQKVGWGGSAEDEEEAEGGEERQMKKHGWPERRVIIIL